MKRCDNGCALSGAELHERLKQVDAAAAQRIHVGDHKRLIRRWRFLN